MSPNKEDLNTKLLRQLQCPVCLDHLTTPIYMCSNGHSVCASCQAQLGKCSICRAPGRPSLRSVQLEKIAELVKLPCDNQPYGCKLLYSFKDMAIHLPKCTFGFKCHWCEVWNGSAADLERHVYVDHSDSLYSSSGSWSLWTALPTTLKYQDKSFFYFLPFNGDIFWLEDRYTSATRIFSRSLRIVSNDERAASRYFYSVEFKPKYTERMGHAKVFHQADVLTENSKERNMEIVLPNSIIDSYDDGKIWYNLKLESRDTYYGGC